MLEVVPCVWIPLIEDLTGNSIPPGYQILVEYDPASQWFNAALTITAGWLKQGGRVNCVAASQPPDTLRARLERLGVNVEQLEKDRKTSGVRRLMKLARLLANDEIRPDAVDEARERLLEVLKGEYDRVSKTPEFKAVVLSKGKVKIRAVDWQLSGQLTSGDIIELDIAKENIDDLFEAAGRKLGEGLRKIWWRSRVEEDEGAKTKAKLEAVAFSILPDILLKIEQKTQQTARRWLDDHGQSINGLPESRQQLYNEVRRLATEPEAVMITYPAAIEVRKGDMTFDEHPLR